MRIPLICLLSVVALSCGRLRRKSPAPPAPLVTKYYVTGMYTATEEGRFCVAQDTLVITSRKSLPHQYLITRLSGFQRSLDDQYFPVEHVRSQWYAVYDETSHMLHGINKDAQLEILPALNGVSLYSMVYTRIE